MTELPLLGTARLLIRPLALDDLAHVHKLLDGDALEGSPAIGTAESLGERAEWLQWTVLGYAQLAKLHQPPYGERAIMMKADGSVIGACGLVPCLGPFGQLPSSSSGGQAPEACLFTPEVGLFYAISPPWQRQGYATEAARALVDYAFQGLRLKRIVATTTYDNPASISVMKRLGMRIEQNPLADPPWFQVVGMIENR